MIEGVRNDGGTAQTIGAEADGPSPQDEAFTAAIEEQLGHTLVQLMLGPAGQSQLSVMNFLLEDSRKEFSVNG